MPKNRRKYANEVTLLKRARELEVKAHEILDRLPDLGVGKEKTYSSSIDEDVAIKLRRLYGFDVPDLESETEPEVAEKEEAQQADRAIAEAPVAKPAGPARQEAAASEAATADSQSGSSKLSSKTNRKLIDPNKGGHNRNTVLAHVFETFGSQEKANHWLRRPNHVFEGRTPLEAIERDPQAVEIELTRIDHGVYV
jgi:hypothetical protein